MLLVVDGPKHDAHREELETLYRLRYDNFVVRRKWSLPTRSEMDIDQYDNKTATYFILYDNERRIIGSTRVHRTTDASLLADLFPHLIESHETAKGLGIFEGTRFIISSTLRSQAAQRIARIDLVRAVARWCLDQGGTHLQAVIDAGVFPRFLAMSLRTRPLGLPHDYGGGPRVEGGGRCIAFRWDLSSKLLDDFDAFRAENLAVPSMADAIH